MAKITTLIPEPKEQYEPKNQLNFSFQNDLKEEQDTFNYFLT